MGRARSAIWTTPTCSRPPSPPQKPEPETLVITDFMPLRGSIIGAGDPDTSPTLLRLLDCNEGEVEVALEWSPRFDLREGGHVYRENEKRRARPMRGVTKLAVR